MHNPLTPQEVRELVQDARMFGMHKCLMYLAQALATTPWLEAFSESTLASRNWHPLEIWLKLQREHLIFAAPPGAPPDAARAINAALLDAYDSACSDALERIRSCIAP